MSLTTIVADFLSAFVAKTRSTSLLVSWFTQDVQAYVAFKAEHGGLTPGERELFTRFVRVCVPNDPPADFLDWLRFVPVAESLLVAPWHLSGRTNIQLDTYMLAETSLRAADEQPVEPDDRRLCPRRAAEGLLPFCRNGSGDFHCLDLTPGPDGRTGQVVACFQSARYVWLAGSLADYLSTITTELRLDHFTSQEDPDQPPDSLIRQLIPKEGTKAAQLFAW